MPGHILKFECTCGLKGVAHPGVTEDSWEQGAETMAYNPATQVLETASPKEVEKRGLVVCKDPFLDLAPMDSTRVIENCLCPRCNKRKLKFTHLGFWD